MELVAKLRYMGRQYANGQAARGGGQQKHYLEEAADEIEALRAKAARWDAIETLMILGDVELTQAEDGGYSIYVEPVENILPQSWDGDTPEQAADRVVAQLTTPKRGVEAPARLFAQVASNAGLAPFADANTKPSHRQRTQGTT